MPSAIVEYVALNVCGKSKSLRGGMNLCFQRRDLSKTIGSFNLIKIDQILRM